MDLTALIGQLRPYPALLEILVDHMTDEEFEQYADVLLDEPNGETWLPSGDRAATAEKKADNQRILGLREHVLREFQEDTQPRRGEMTDGSSDLISWRDVPGFAKCLDCLNGSADFAALWCQHVFDNYHLSKDTEPPPDRRTSSVTDWKSFIRQAEYDFVPLPYDMEEVDDLGPDLFGVILGGPYRAVLILSKAALHAVDPLESAFAYCHMISHLHLGHLPRRTWAIRPEYRAGRTPPDLYGYADNSHQYLTGQYFREEGEADERATCMLYPEYCMCSGCDDTCSASLTGRPQHEEVQPLRHFIWEALGAEPDVSVHLRRAGEYLRAIVYDRKLRHPAPPPLKYYGPLRIVRPEKDCRAYVIGRARSDNHRGWRRWICSARVLQRLGVSFEDIEVMSDHALEAYSYEPPLLRPADVDQVRKHLAESIIKRRKKYLTPDLSSV